MAQLLAMDTRERPSRPQFIDISGQTFGNLKVIKYHGRRNGKIYFVCECKCGTKLAVMGEQLRNGSAKKCRAKCTAE